MTQFIGAQNSGLNDLFRADDRRAVGQFYQQDVEVVDFGPAVGDMRWPWWPGGAGFFGDVSADIGLLEAEGSWDFPDLTQGGMARYGVIGVTRDAYGVPLAGMTVRLVRWSDGLLVDSTTSDASGNYAVYTPYYPDAHQIQTYKSGTPDVFGCSVNTLIGR